ncbi:MAG: hypothetical protein M1423_09760 [Acidobacteria bacterium]|nr:hypothetical protein [Acidobacteriota bacterium]
MMERILPVGALAAGLGLAAQAPARKVTAKPSDHKAVTCCGRCAPKPSTCRMMKQARTRCAMNTGRQD